jgi:hypothetical protein
VKPPECKTKCHNQKGDRKPSPGNAGGTVARVFVGKSRCRGHSQFCHSTALWGDFRHSGAGGELVFGYRLGFVHSDRTSVGLHKAFVEDTPGKLVEVFFLDGDQEAGTDLRRPGDLLEADLALLPFPL